MSEGFLTDLSTAELFFRFCARYRIVNENERIVLMREIVRRKKAKYIRDVGEFVQGKRVGFITDRSKETK